MPHEQHATEDVASSDQMLTAKQVAKRLGIHVSTVYRLGPDLGAQKFGKGEIRRRGFRVPESRVAALMQGAKAA